MRKTSSANSLPFFVVGYFTKTTGSPGKLPRVEKKHGNLRGKHEPS